MGDTGFPGGDQTEKGFRDHKCLWHNGNPLLKDPLIPKESQTTDTKEFLC